MICPCCGKHKRPANLGALGTALKPAMELIAVARKPLSEKTIAANVLAHGTGAINVDGCRVAHTDPMKTTERSAPRYSGVTMNGGKRGGEQSGIASADPLGRWPANVITDGSAEVLAGFPESGPGPGNVHTAKDNAGGVFGGGRMGVENIFKDSGSAARFFYTAKADSDDRLGSSHPTVKPVDLMQWLCRLVTPPGGTILDPFSGTGTTGEAAFREGFNAVLIEREEEYQNDIRRRMGLVLSGPEERARESIKARQGDALPDHGPLFGGSDTIGPHGWRIYGVFADEPGERE